MTELRIKMIKNELFIILLSLFILLVPADNAVCDVTSTLHNFSISGKGRVKSLEEKEVCKFCHASHLNRPLKALWNHKLSSVKNYKLYQSKTIGFVPGQPDGASKLCLSCHDGTVAIGMLIKGKVDPKYMTGVDSSGRITPDSKGYLGTDLSGMHPVSFVFNKDLIIKRKANRLSGLKLPPRIGRDRTLLDEKGKVQCTSCHDPHNDDYYSPQKKIPHFWRTPTWDGVCLKCHEPINLQSGHADRSKLPLGCGSCHKGHGVPGTPMLYAKEEELCFDCHNGKQRRRATKDQKRLAQDVTLRDDKEDFKKYSHHPIELSGLHSPLEKITGRIDQNKMHSECVDCHDPHLVTSSSNFILKKPFFPKIIVYNYESGWNKVCLNCHGNSSNDNTFIRDKRMEFDPGNRSYHPVLAAGRNKDVPSLLKPYNTDSIIGCMDCHGSDEKGVKNVHGSGYIAILKFNYTRKDGIAETYFVYQLCYNCHDRNSILSDQSFKYQKLHIVDQKTSCYTCHDSHGSKKNTNLIRFNKDPRFTKVSPSKNGRLEFIDLGAFRGECYLNCHGKEHNPASF